MTYLTREQQDRDSGDLANVCAACGHDATAADPLVLTTGDGWRIHRSHTTDPRSGFYRRPIQVEARS